MGVFVGGLKLGGLDFSLIFFLGWWWCCWSQGVWLVLENDTPDFLSLIALALSSLPSIIGLVCGHAGASKMYVHGNLTRHSGRD